MQLMLLFPKFASTHLFIYWQHLDLTTSLNFPTTVCHFHLCLIFSNNGTELYEEPIEGSYEEWNKFNILKKNIGAA
jgi:hypothetical protein